MRAATGVLVLALLSGACATTAPETPYDSGFGGTYMLVSLNGQQVPVYSGGSETLVGGFCILHSQAEFTLEFWVKEVGRETQRSSKVFGSFTVQEAGTGGKEWRVRFESLKGENDGFDSITWTAVHTFGTIQGNELRIDRGGDSLGRMVFRKIES